MDFNSILFILTWIVLIPVWLFFLKSLNSGILKISVISFFFLFFIMYQYLGFPILFFKLDDYRADFVTDNLILLKVFYINSLVMSLVFAGYFLCSTFMNNFTIGTRLENRFEKNRSLILTLIIFFIAFFALALYISKVGFTNLAIIAALNSAGNDAIAFSRSEMSNAFAGKFHWYKLGMRDFMFISTASFMLIFFKARNFKTSILLLISLLLSTFSSIFTGEKGIIIDLFLILLVSFFIIDNKKIKLSSVFLIVSSSLIILIVLYNLFMGVDGVTKGIASVFSRLLTGQLQPTYHYVEFFPKYQDFLHGRSFPNPGGIFSYEPYNLTFEVMNWVSPSPLDKSIGVVGSMPTIFWGELYANFGIIFTLLCSLFIGFLFKIIDKILSLRNNDPLIVSLCAWVVIHYKDLAITGISSFIIDFYLVLIFLLACIMFIVRKNLYIPFQNR